MAAFTRFPTGSEKSRFTRDRGESSRAQSPAPTRDPDDAQTAPPDGSKRPGRGIAKPSSGASVVAEKRSKFLLTLFLVSLLIPLQIDIGTLLLNPHRMFLVVMFIPMFAMWISGQSGKVHGTDFLFLGYVFWMAVTYMVNHGFSRMQLVGITTVESLGAYLAGRYLVRTKEDYDWLLKFLTLALLVFLPAAVLESMTGIRVFAKIADAIGRTYTWVHSLPNYEKRLGMFRTQMVFEHPILFGVFASTTFGLVYYRMRPNGKGIYGYRLAILSFANTFFPCPAAQSCRFPPRSA